MAMGVSFSGNCREMIIGEWRLEIRKWEIQILLRVRV